MDPDRRMSKIDSCRFPAGSGTASSRATGTGAAERDTTTSGRTRMGYDDDRSPPR